MSTADQLLVRRPGGLSAVEGTSGELPHVYVSRRGVAGHPTALRASRSERGPTTSMGGGPPHRRFDSTSRRARGCRWRHEVSGPSRLGVNPPWRAVAGRGSHGLMAHDPSSGMNRLARAGALSTRPSSPGRGAAGQWLLTGVAGARGVLGVVRLTEADERHVARRASVGPSARRSA
jgi:hypothetical protein